MGKIQTVVSYYQVAAAAAAAAAETQISQLDTFLAVVRWSYSNLRCHLRNFRARCDSCNLRLCR